MSGKGSGRRPGKGYAEGWDAIFSGDTVNKVSALKCQGQLYIDGWRDALEAAASMCDRILWDIRDAGEDGAEHCGACSEAIREMLRISNEKNKED